MLADPLAGLHTPLTDLLFLRCRVASAGTVVDWLLATLAVTGYTGIARRVDAPGRHEREPGWPARPGPARSP